MRRLILLLVIGVAALSAACGRAPAAATQAPATSAASTQPPSSGNSTQVVVTLADNTIESSLTDFQVGVPYTFVITNKGPHAHDFNISQPVSVVGSLDAALKGALLVVPQQKLGRGETATVDFTFPESATSLKWEFSCLIRRHYDDGMRLAITVTK